MASTDKTQRHPSWVKTGPSTYTQPYGFQEVLYTAISVPPGSPGLFIVATAVTLNHDPSSPGRSLSSSDLVRLLQNAWLQMRQQYPTLAAENRPEGKVYNVPSSPADLAAWLADTFIVTPGKTWTDLWRTMVRTRQMTMYFCPEARQLFVQAEHQLLDGRGGMNFWDRYFKALASPAAIQDLMKTDGSEVARLPPRSDDLLDMREKKPGRGEQRALELLAPVATMSAPITMPVSLPLPRRSPHNAALVLKVSTSSTESIIAACRAQGLSVTAAWHTAVVLATQSIQTKHSVLAARQAGEKPKTPGTQFASFSNFDLRRYFPAPEDTPFPMPDAYALSNHHCVLPCIVTPGGKTFAQVARELASYYQRDLPKADPEVWSALGPMIRMMVPEFTRDPLEDTTPALSSLGVIDHFIASSYAQADGEGVWRVQDVWFGDTVTGPWLDHFMWAWQGQLSFNSCYNPAYYTHAEVDEFNHQVLERLLDGLGVPGREPRWKL